MGLTDLPLLAEFIAITNEQTLSQRDEIDQLQTTLSLLIPKAVQRYIRDSAGEGQPSELDDRLLTASEVAQLRLNADWVVLSARLSTADRKSLS